MNLRVAKILILTIASFFTVIAASAALVGDTVECGGLYYKVLPGDSTLCLIAPAGGYTDEAIVIPPTVTVEKSYNVTAIDQRALAGNMALKQVSLPSTISEMGDEVFADCDSLTTVFSHVPNALQLVPQLPDGVRLCVDCQLVDAYSQICDNALTVLIDVSSEPRSANLCDVNRDGVVNASDVTVVYNHLLGNDQHQADANGDGVVTAVDVTVIYTALLNGNTSGVGDKGYSFATYEESTGHVAVRIDEKIHLQVGDEVCLVAHDNENALIVASGLGMMKGALPWGEIKSVNDIQVFSLNNKHYNTGTTSQVVLYFDTGQDTIYYKDVQVEVAPHVVTDTLRVLSIGNSFSLDALSYVPFIMKAVAPEIYLKLGVMYIGGGSLENFHNALDTNGFRYYWSYGAKPWDERLNVSMTETIQSQPWDVIVLQQQSYASRYYSTYQPYLNQLIGWLDEHTSYNHEYAWLITPSYPDGLDRLAPDTTSVQMFERILQCVSNLQQDTGIELLLPCGTAIQNARTTPLDSLGDFGHLFDYLHLQDGIPCLIEAYVACAALLDRYGLSNRVWTDTTWIDQQWLRAKNIQEINGLPVGMSEESRAIAKQCAIKALENPLSITTIE